MGDETLTAIMRRDPRMFERYLDLLREHRFRSNISSMLKRDLWNGSRSRYRSNITDA